ncbi:hypothetical protein [Peterkaempfera griseoplana]|uniref:hypothetical protein n=1 Tax=Peterkaempfera griseoplana TaxID=66896 RepID=UPI0006E40F13|nr:hypothetical protein [Peterkaempfera griseoplana]
MTTLRLADPGEAADLASFLSRLLRYDRAAAVRLQAAASATAGSGVLAVFGRLPLGASGVVAIRAARLREEPKETLDATVSAGQLLEALDEEAAALAVPPTVTGPAWTGMLPPRSGWRPLGALPGAPVAAAVAGAVAEFRSRSEAMPPEDRTRAALDALADEIWSRPLDSTAELPLRAVHGAQVLGFLRPGAELSVFQAGGWLRLSCPHGSVALRRTAGPGSGLGLTPLS